MSEDNPKLRTMVLLSVKKKYTSKWEPLTLLDSSDDAAAIIALTERAGVTEEIVAVEVPIWPALRSDDNE